MSAHELKNRLQDTGGYDARVTVLGYIHGEGAPRLSIPCWRPGWGPSLWSPCLREIGLHGLLHLRADDSLPPGGRMEIPEASQS